MAISTTFARIPIDAVRITDMRSSWRTKARCAPNAMRELVQCVSARRWLQAITVRKLVDSQYELLDGERRLLAAREAGESHIDALVVEADDATAAAICLLANLGGAKLKAVEKASAIAQVRDALAASGASATQEAVGEWVGLRQPTVHQYLAIADAFPADLLATLGITSDTMAAFPANVLEKVAKTTASERRDWLERVRDGVESPRRGATSGADKVARHVRQLRDTCLQQQSTGSATETATVLIELLGVVRILAAQVATTGVISASGAVREGLAKARDYRSPIIRVLNWTRRLRHSLLRGRARLNRSAGKFATRLRRSMSTSISLTTFVDSARQIVKRDRREPLRSEGTRAEDPNIPYANTSVRTMSDGPIR